MSENLPYPSGPQHYDSGFSLKEKLGYTIVLGIGAGIAIYFGAKKVRRDRASKADAKSFDEGSPATLAKQIKMALDNKWDFGPDVKTLRHILIGIKTKAQLDQVRAEYKNEYSITGHDADMFADIASQVKSTQYTELVEIMAGKPVKKGQVPTSVQYTAWARRIKAGFDHKYTVFSSTEQDAIQAALYEIPTQQAFINVGIAYQKEFHTPIIADMKSKLGSDYFAYITLITKKPKN